MFSLKKFESSSLDTKIKILYQRGTYVTSIRYYRYKVNLYLLETNYVEVFIQHKQSLIEKVEFLDTRHSRMKFYADQIKLSFC
jgi:hypothetical protein